jgi:hypothetical protein
MATKRALSSAAKLLTKQFNCQWIPATATSQPLNFILTRGVKTTSTIHPKPVHKDDEQVLEKVLRERENSEDLVRTYYHLKKRKNFDLTILIFV